MLNILCFCQIFLKYWGAMVDSNIDCYKFISKELLNPIKKTNTSLFLICWISWRIAYYICKQKVLLSKQVIWYLLYSFVPAGPYIHHNLYIMEQNFCCELEEQLRVSQASKQNWSLLEEELQTLLQRLTATLAGSNLKKTVWKRKVTKTKNQNERWKSET